MAQEIQAPILSVYDESGNKILIPAIKGDAGSPGPIGPEGPAGSSGVYIGPTPPDDQTINVWIDDSSDTETTDKTLTLSNFPADAKTVGDSLKQKVSFSSPGESGQFAVSDGHGGITWISLNHAEGRSF